MAVLLPPKWITTVSADEPPSRLALVTLTGRLEAVVALLPRAARHGDDDPELVHQLRVWTRRAGSAIVLFGNNLPQRRARWIARRLKLIRKSCNPARDGDVLIERVMQEPTWSSLQQWLEVLRSDRRKAQRKLRQVARDLRRDDDFPGRVAAFLKKLRRRDSHHSPEELLLTDWARERLRPLSSDFFSSIPADWQDDTALHRLRVRTKHVRYALEPLAGCFPEDLRTNLVPQIESLQDALGVVQDLAIARKRLHSDLHHSRLPETSELQNLLSRWNDASRRAKSLLAAQWPAERFVEVEREFRELLDG